MQVFPSAERLEKVHSVTGYVLWPFSCLCVGSFSFANMKLCAVLLNRLRWLRVFLGNCARKNTVLFFFSVGLLMKHY